MRELGRTFLNDSPGAEPWSGDYGDGTMTGFLKTFADVYKTSTSAHGGPPGLVKDPRCDLRAELSGRDAHQTGSVLSVAVQSTLVRSLLPSNRSRLDDRSMA